MKADVSIKYVIKMRGEVEKKINAKLSEQEDGEASVNLRRSIIQFVVDELIKMLGNAHDSGKPDSWPSQVLAQPPRCRNVAERMRCPEPVYSALSPLKPSQTRAFSFFSNFLAPGWAPGPVQMCRDRRDIAGHALKAGFGRDFVEKVDFSSKIRSPSATYPFFGPLIHEYLSMNASTRFVVFSSAKLLKYIYCLPILLPKSMTNG